MQPIHISCFQSALRSLLGLSSDGAMAFVRCLDRELLDVLLLNELFSIDGWSVYGVSDSHALSSQWISSDRAVELREARDGSTLLLVDANTSGAGMDGIYSAANEITEKLLFKALRDTAEDRLPRGTKGIARAAIRISKKLGGRRTIAPWREFDFLARCADRPGDMGIHVALLGLWPVGVTGPLSERSWEISAGVTARLFLDRGAANTTQGLVDGLLIPSSNANLATQLVGFLHANAHLPWQEICRKVADPVHSKIWLDQLNPGFADSKLHEIKLLSWRGSGERLLQWSGLRQQELENAPIYNVPEAGTSNPQRITVRWSTQPPRLPRGTLDYRVSIRKGEDEVLAERIVPHSGGASYEKCSFGPDDFEELREDGGTWDVQITVSPEAHTFRAVEGGDDALCSESEPFIITFHGGNQLEASESSSARVVRTMVEFAISLSDREAVREACTTSCTLDKQGHIVWRAGRRSGKVLRPALLGVLQEQWRKADYAVGSWTIRIRDDGALLDAPEFVGLTERAFEAVTWTRMADVTRRLAKRTDPRHGFLGFLHAENEADNYVNAWISAFQDGEPGIACVNTVLVFDQQGNRRGRLVLPWHPLRVAWQQAFDRFALHCRFDEGVPFRRTEALLNQLDSNYFPLFLPGTEPGESYVFGDVLGFHTVAMLNWDEQEPQAALALMTRCLFPKSSETAGIVGYSAAEAIGKEISRFSELHPECHVATVNALRAGDGLTLSRALGKAIEGKDNLDDHEGSIGIEGYVLSLHPSNANDRMRLLGRHLTETSERRRAGVGAALREDRWMLSSYSKDGIPLPRLRWKRSSDSMPTMPGHLAIAFDTFESYMETMKKVEVEESHIIEGYGLYAPVSRSFSTKPTPHWLTTLSPSPDGLKHPAGRALSDRLYELHSQLMRLTATHNSMGGGDWPALVTAISGERADALMRLHELHEWVLTVDRNAGLEYFDSPRENPDVYDTYVIDCVPEREDLDSVRLVTSTSQLEELKRLLNDALAEMGLSGSPKNCVDLLKALKTISGRLAMRLANNGASRQELIALALLSHLFIAHRDRSEGACLSLERGFLVPLDDVRDLLLDGTRGAENLQTVRADLLYIELVGKSDLTWTLIEVKYRRLLRTARESLVIDRIHEQTLSSESAIIERYFGKNVTEAEKVVRRKRLVRALKFYADKARRHELQDDVYTKIILGLNKLLRPDQHQEIPVFKRKGYVFCPEFRGEFEELTTNDEEVVVHLFGPDFLLPLKQRGDWAARSLTSSCSEQQGSEIPFAPQSNEKVHASDSNLYPLQDSTQVKSEEVQRATTAAITPALLERVAVSLGKNSRTGESVSWHPSINGNPHLMIVGLPGMGKTACIVNLCLQLAESGVRPIVFAYHDDIEDRLCEKLGSIEPLDVQAGLGFNPMKVVGNHSHAWVDHVGMLRDIFSCIFPDFGDRQTNEIREALKESYRKAGFNEPDADPRTLTPPEFRRFFSLIKSGQKPNAGVVERLTELDDYGFFTASGDAATLLEPGPPAVVRLYTSRNEVLQRATAAFVLLHLYQSMFIRGEQKGLSHAVIFDEAHRASGLKLLATMAKECRKYGIALIVSSQAARDFDPGLFSSIANYLTLRMTEVDALSLAKNVAGADESRRLAGQLKKLEKFHALFFSEGTRDTLVNLRSPFD